MARGLDDTAASVAPLACTASFAGTMTPWNFLNSSAWLQPCELCLPQLLDVKQDCNLIVVIQTLRSPQLSMSQPLRPPTPSCM